MHHITARYNFLGKRKNIILVSWFVFFFLIFDGIFAYMSPLLMEHAGFNDIQIGYILSSSSLAGLLADFVLCRFLKNVKYKRVFFMMLAVAGLAQIVLWGANTLPLFIVAMAMWGIYYDLLTIGQLNFVGNNTRTSEHVTTYSVLRVSIALGSIVALIISGGIGQKYPDLIPYIGGATLLVCFTLFFGLTVKKEPKLKQKYKIKKTSFYRQMIIWRKNAIQRGGLLFGIFFLNVIDSAFWQLSPAIGENTGLPYIVRAYYMIPYQLAPLIIGIIMSNYIMRKRVNFLAHYSLITACVALSSLFFFSDVRIIVVANVVASLFMGLAWPTYWGAYSTAIAKNPRIQEELETIGDAFTNIGYIFGPIAVGYLAEAFGNIRAFGAIGMIGATIVVITVIRKKINTAL